MGALGWTVNARRLITELCIGAFCHCACTRACVLRARLGIFVDLKSRRKCSVLDQNSKDTGLCWHLLLDAHQCCHRYLQWPVTETLQMTQKKKRPDKRPARHQCPSRPAIPFSSGVDLAQTSEEELGFVLGYSNWFQ